MTRINVTASKNYDVIIGSGIIENIGSEIKNIRSDCKIMLVCDDIVNGLYRERVEKLLSDDGFIVKTFCFENGENSKTQDILFDLLECLADSNFDRHDILVALGGGVVGDLTGFAASVYMRGIDFVQLPTTLLAAVDSSVGGKTAVNLKNGKNLAGTFWQPMLVMCDIDFMKTLPKEIFASGAAEVIKYGMIIDADLFEKLENGALEKDLEGVITRCVEIKRDVVAADEFDKGSRAILNFGHTMGHALEKVSDYTISHGFAVGMGMAMISKAAAKAGLCEDVNARLVPLLQRYGIPTECPYNANQICAVAFKDKKKDGDGINLILPKSIGKCYIYKASTYEMIKFIELGIN